MKVTICMGSACFIKGSKKIADAFISLVDEYGLEDKVDLWGAFCMGRCKDGVNVDVDGELYSVTPDGAVEFFKNKILSEIKK